MFEMALTPPSLPKERHSSLLETKDTFTWKPTCPEWPVSILIFRSIRLAFLSEWSGRRPNRRPPTGQLMSTER